MAVSAEISIGSNGRCGGSESGLPVQVAPIEPPLEEFAMARAYYSTVIQHSAPNVWKIIRDFNSYSVWIDGAGESRIEDRKSGDTVGAIRMCSIGPGRSGKGCRHFPTSRGWFPARAPIFNELRQYRSVFAPTWGNLVCI